jgi:hypothetical protein
MKKEESIYSSVCNIKMSMPKHEQKDVIYAFNCQSCGEKYIGETSQTITERRAQHMRDVKKGVSTNGFFNHLKNAENHEIDWENFQILGHESNWHLRKIKESVFIDMWNPEDKINRLMNIDKGLKIERCWKGLIPTLRNIALEWPGQKTDDLSTEDF